MRVAVEGAGELSLEDLELSPMGEHLRLVSGPIQAALDTRGTRYDGGLRRLAADLDPSTLSVGRLLGDGGVLEERGTSLRASKILIQMRDDRALSISLQTRDGESRGAASLSLARKIDGLSLHVEAAGAHLAWLKPWLPAAWITPGTASGALSLQWNGEGAEIHGDLQLVGSAIRHASLARGALELSPSLRFEARTRRDPRYWDVVVHEAVLGAIRWTGHFTGEWGARALPERLQASLTLARVECASALDSLPLALRDRLAGLDLTGQMGGDIQLVIAADRSADLRWDLGVSEGCAVAGEPPGASALDLKRPLEHVTPHGNVLRLWPSSEDFAPIARLPRHVRAAFVSAEDGSFLHHRGFDIHQIARSLSIDFQEGAFVRGGSTISQQLVKNLFLTRDKSLSRKLQEAVLTWRLESVLSKERILELYLNIIELGDEGTYGIAAASRRWFGVEPEDLTVKQAAFLAALTPEPTSMSARLRKAQGLDPISEERLDLILRVMRRDRAISDREFRKAHKRPLHLASRALVRAPRRSRPATTRR
jgi:hypothetical protein